MNARRSIRWWPGISLVAFAAVGILWVRAQEDWPFQKRNLTTLQVLLIAGILLGLWWTFLSRARKRLRLGVTCGLLAVFLAGFGLFRIRGMSGDMLPIVEFRWSPARAALIQRSAATMDVPPESAPAGDFPQFYGPDRNGVLTGPALRTNWNEAPPVPLWRVPVGAGWSGFAVFGNSCVTQEQRGSDECVVARDLATGAERWRHADAARFGNTIAGEGPRATPTIAGGRVFTFGSTGRLNCLELATGKKLWCRDVIREFGGKVPLWGAASSPLLVDGRVIVHGGEGAPHSLFAFNADDGSLAWQAGTSSSYASPIVATVAGVRQVVAFNDGSASGHDPATGGLLWQWPWGNGNVVCATPLVVSSNRVLFSSGYGVGAELLELSPGERPRLRVARVWRSIRMKAKFAHLFIRDGALFGLDDGILAAVNLADGAQLWKEGRHGHGQGIVVGEHYLLLSERGELVLLRPTRSAPGELARFRVFDSKTWNPPALAGDLLLVRNDREAVCLRLPVVE